MAKESMKIREATENDVSLILFFIKEIAKYEKMEADVVATEELLRYWLFEQQKAEVIIGEVDGKPVGFALYFYNFSTFLGRAGLYLEDLYLLPDYRGKGFGKQFFKKLAQTAVQKGCGRMEWCCLDWNVNSIAFYQSMGAIPMEEWTTYRLTGDTLTELAKE